MSHLHYPAEIFSLHIHQYFPNRVMTCTLAGQKKIVLCLKCAVSPIIYLKYSTKTVNTHAIKYRTSQQNKSALYYTVNI